MRFDFTVKTIKIKHSLKTAMVIRPIKNVHVYAENEEQAKEQIKQKGWIILDETNKL